MPTKKITPCLRYSCQFSKSFQNNFFTKHLGTTASVGSKFAECCRWMGTFYRKISWRVTMKFLRHLSLWTWDLSSFIIYFISFPYSFVWKKQLSMTIVDFVKHVEIHSAYCSYLPNGSEFFNELLHFKQRFSRNIFTFQWLKFETPEHTQLTISH